MMNVLNYSYNSLNISVQRHVTKTLYNDNTQAWNLQRGIKPWAEIMTAYHDAHRNVLD